MKILISISLIFIIIVSIFLLIVFLCYSENKIQNKNHINKKVKDLFKSGKADLVYSFYDSFIKNKELTINIVNNALCVDVPIHYFIAITWQESKFKPKARHTRNSDGSIDYGVFGLNSKTYKNYSKEYLEKIENNCRFAANHLLEAYNKSNNWYSAIGIYNAGNENNINFKYVRNVLLYSDDLDNEFFEKMCK